MGVVDDGISYFSLDVQGIVLVAKETASLNVK